MFEQKGTEVTKNKAQLLSYLKTLDIPIGLIINLNALTLTAGLSRLILPGAKLSIDSTG